MKTPRPTSALRRIPGSFARGARQLWERVRPFTPPRYVPETPELTSGHPLDPLLPPNPATLGDAALDEETATFVNDVLKRLTVTDEQAEQIQFQTLAREKFGRHWRFANILTVLRAAASLLNPNSYLEIGVHRGRSMAMVAASRPTCDLYGFDLWLPEYRGLASPGPDFVRKELAAVGHAGDVTLVSGDSRRTVPEFLRAHPDLYFDLITVDGDHSVEGAAVDLANTLPRLKVGGILVFDDIASAPHLKRVWEKVIERESRFVSWQFSEAGAGVAAAIRVSDGPAVGPLYWQ